MFVHHTDGANDYSCTESASIVRGIYAYHVQVEGWKDIGYNFLVDKCGTVFEGRKGGVDLPVLGAHTYGWNRESTGIAVLGDYTTTSASNAALASIARVAAWKLGQYGADPAGTTQLTAGAGQKNYFGTSFTTGTKYTFQRISGHRDGYNTQCPGGSLYAQLPTIRAWAAGPVQGLKTTTVDGAGLSGSTYYTKGAITVHWTATTPSSLIKNFQLLVDGKVVATTSGTATSAAATLALGGHTVAVRAVHQSGKTATSAALSVMAETTAPTFTTTPALPALRHRQHHRRPGHPRLEGDGRQGPALCEAAVPPRPPTVRPPPASAAPPSPAPPPPGRCAPTTTRATPVPPRPLSPP